METLQQMRLTLGLPWDYKTTTAAVRGEASEYCGGTSMTGYRVLYMKYVLSKNQNVAMVSG